MKSWRQDAVDRLDAFCGLNPQALGTGPIRGGDWWKNRFEKEKAMPSKTLKQHKAMGAAAKGKSGLGIPKKVGKDFIKADKGKSFSKSPRK